MCHGIYVVAEHMTTKSICLKKHDRDAHPQAARRAARRLRWTGVGGRHDGLMVFRPDPKPRIFATEVPKPPALVAKPGAGESGSSAGRIGG